MKPAEKGGSRIAIVFNGSPLFTGAAGSGESEIRRWIIENDWLEAVVALPDQLFFNTGISTYFWIVSNRKSEERRGKVQLIDARECFEKMRKSLGEKRKQISDDQIAEITRLYADFTEGDQVKIFPNEAFGYMRITVERPLKVSWTINDSTLTALEKAKAWKTYAAEHAITAQELLGADGIAGSLWGRTWTSAKAFEADARGAGVPAALMKDLVKAAAQADPEGVLVTDRHGNPLPDADLRDNENVPLPAGSTPWDDDVTERLESAAYRAAIDDYVAAEVLPYVADAWVDYDKTKVGYEVPLTRHFYRYVPPRPLAEIDAEIKALETEIQELLSEVTQ